MHADADHQLGGAPRVGAARDVRRRHRQRGLAVDPQRIKQRLTALKGLRSPHEQVWRDCFDYSFPERGDGFSGEKNDATALQQKRARLMDGTSTDSCQILAAAINKAKSLEPKAIALAMEDLTYDSVVGPVRMRGEDHQLLLPQVVNTIAPVDGKSVKVGWEGTNYGFKTDAGDCAEFCVWA